jgi:hypothetical protein
MWNYNQSVAKQYLDSSLGFSFAPPPVSRIVTVQTNISASTNSCRFDQWTVVANRALFAQQGINITTFTFRYTAPPPPLLLRHCSLRLFAAKLGHRAPRGRGAAIKVLEGMECRVVMPRWWGKGRSKASPHATSEELVSVAGWLIGEAPGVGSRRM